MSGQKQAVLVQVAAALEQRLEKPGMPTAMEQRRLQMTIGISCARAAAWPSTGRIRSPLDASALVSLYL